MTSRRRATAALLGLAIASACVLLVPASASAHPLGNFTVNHYHGLHLHPDRIDDHAVLDEAELPTVQQRAVIDRDADGVVTDAEESAYATGTCRRFAEGLHADVDGTRLTWQVTRSTFSYQPGAAGLKTGRTECHLTAPADLRTPRTLTLADQFRPDRISWYESPQPGTTSVSTTPRSRPPRSVTNYAATRTTCSRPRSTSDTSNCTPAHRVRPPERRPASWSPSPDR